MFWFAVQCHFAGSWLQQYQMVLSTEMRCDWYIFCWSTLFVHCTCIEELGILLCVKKSCFLCKRADTGTRAAEEEAMQQLPRAAGTAKYFVRVLRVFCCNKYLAIAVVFRVSQSCHWYYIDWSWITQLQCGDNLFQCSKDPIIWILCLYSSQYRCRSWGTVFVL